MEFIFISFCKVSLVCSFIFSLPSNYEKIENGIVFHLLLDEKGLARTVRLQVVNENIIHVSASPEKNFKDNPSLILQEKFIAGEDEALYGLGQHQAELINYRHRQVDLTQYNGVAVVPFMMSSHRYGILWDNYLISKFGDTRPVQSLSDLALFPSKNAPSQGLKAVYASQGENPEIGLEKMPDFDVVRGAVTCMKTENLHAFPSLTIIFPVS